MGFYGCPLLLSLFVFFILACNAHSPAAMKLNVIDGCWRRSTYWERHRHQLATCSVGFSGKMTGNIGGDVTQYEVTDAGDHPLSPKPGTLRFGATSIKGKVWITFRHDMKIKLEKPLLVSSFTAIDGRGASVHIAGGGCILLHEVSNVIIHGIRIHECQPQSPGRVLGPDSELELGEVDGDAIRLVASSKIWIDHNTLYECHDGLLDVTRGSTDITGDQKTRAAHMEDHGIFSLFGMSLKMELFSAKLVTLHIIGHTTTIYRCSELQMPEL